MVAAWISSRFCTPHSSRNSRIGSAAEPTEIYAISAKFFTSPTAWPSGVSAGHTIPPRQSATAKLEKDTLHPVILKTKSLRALKNILVAENLTQHGINKLPVLIRLSVLLLLLGLAISIILTKGA